LPDPRKTRSASRPRARSGGAVQVESQDPSFPPASLRVAEILAALSQVLDLGSGSAAGHSERTCILGMRIASEMQLARSDRSDLYYALLLQDAGCLNRTLGIYRAMGFPETQGMRERSRAEEYCLDRTALEYAVAHAAPGGTFSARSTDILRLASERTKAELRYPLQRRAQALARTMGLSEGTALAIANSQEHWDGSGSPNKLAGNQIPATSRILFLAQKLDIFYTSLGMEHAIRVMQERSARWFDPDIVRAATTLASGGDLWAGLEDSDGDESGLTGLAVELEPDPKTIRESPIVLDAICRLFAAIVDAKSSYTYQHSNGVANAAIAMANGLGLDQNRTLLVRHAALLHDIGKMAVPNSILEKRGALSAAEQRIMQAHPERTWRILKGVGGFEQVSEVAASHHERLNGSGYFRGLVASQLSLEARIVMVADVFDALSADRPYRTAMPIEEVFRTIRNGVPHEFDADCVEALERSGIGGDQKYYDLDMLKLQLNANRPKASDLPLSLYASTIATASGGSSIASLHT